ncbi:class Ib ribonucleoside-diphosphate reductase assembly flavoprotein NrdI [Streptococcus ratti]|uniref:Putative NrdI-like protein n=1 Tax=Streptococcus ratti FA-1 = DSM 20564 TaxID=699248 RepID=A0ABN0GXD7_STRRT|nr:class Ib ribonucleoside-diphosphate reductase assembly flavoprotein NrdI [Streptococcus ratti]EJN95044.1 flavoprotein NrdI [Streptococcus ratti FA-1 = DSM 20564]EMP70504.1 ribonucleotide reductase [Streptococcus ratti FA-1 = DSM 20564]QEY07044.1 class Ib ribonucleoside-diphosphate reductase assembly flavoprotein NrdI [Streptococcus ratti]VEI59467.1 ribonucleotide reductase [Streptococcus mutans]
MASSINLVYISLSGNTQSFVNRLKTYLQSKTDMPVNTVNIKDLVKDQEDFFAMTDYFVAFLPTYLEGGNGLDSGDVEILTTPLRDFIAFADNYRYCYGVVGSGNKNFNNQYCLTAKQYSQAFGFPMLDDFELRGLTDDVKRIGEKILKLYAAV